MKYKLYQLSILKRCITPILLFLSSFVSSQKTYENVDRIILAEMKKRNITGASIALVDSSGIIFSKGYGFADKANKLFASSQTVYPFGSISKVITTASILKLQDLGKLDIDSAFVKYVPEFQIKQHFHEKRPFTIADLLMHQGGIPRTRLKDLYTDFAQPADFYKIIEEEKEDYLIAPPGEIYQYSDIGMTIPGVLPFKTTHKHYVEFVNDEIFKPSGMSNASFHKDSAKNNYTKGYQNGVETRIFATRFLPAFGMQASVEDLAKFLFVFLNKGTAIDGTQVLSPELVQRAIKQQNQATKLVFSNKMGLGWMLEGFHGYQCVYHGGEQKPCLSMVRMLPELKLGIVLAINSNMDRDFISIVVEKVLLEIFKEKKIPYSRDYKEKVKSSRSLRYSLTNSFTGDYATSYGIVNISRAKKKLQVNMISIDRKFNAKIMTDSTLQLNYMIMGMIPVKVMRLFVTEINNRKIIGIKLIGGRKIFGGEAIIFDKPRTEWDSVAGKYIICNLDDQEYSLLKEIEVSEYKGIKVISGKGDIPDVEQFQFCIRPINDNLAIVQGIGGQGLLGETIKRRKINGEEFIEICGYLLKK